MKTIILHSKEHDLDLLHDLREALKSKGLVDDFKWNDNVQREPMRYDSVYIGNVGNGGSNNITFLNERDRIESKKYLYIPVSRDDFQTMFLLY